MAGTELDLTGAVWRKARRSSGNGGDCVEVAAVTGTKEGVHQPMIAVRDSKNPSGAVLGFTHAEWDAFVDGASKSEFDLL